MNDCAEKLFYNPNTSWGPPAEREEKETQSKPGGRLVGDHPLQLVGSLGPEWPTGQDSGQIKQENGPISSEQPSYLT